MIATVAIETYRLGGGVVRAHVAYPVSSLVLCCQCVASGRSARVRGPL